MRDPGVRAKMAQAATRMAQELRSEHWMPRLVRRLRDVAPAPTDVHSATISKARPAIAKALRYLAYAQNRDGSWGDNAGTPGEIGNTCIAILAFLATGDTMTKGRHCRRIRRAVEHASFDKLQAMERETGFVERSKYSDRFFRSGQSGAWKGKLTPEQARRIERDHGEQMQRFGYV